MISELQNTDLFKFQINSKVQVFQNAENFIFCLSL